MKNIKNNTNCFKTVFSLKKLTFICIDIYTINNDNDKIIDKADVKFNQIKY